MKLRTKGKILNISSSIVVKATRFKHKLNQPNYCYVIDSEDMIMKKYESELIITISNKIEKSYKGKIVFGIKDLMHISEDDIIYIGNDGKVQTMYRTNSSQNYLLVTDRCNSNCIMCSQPPKDRDDIEFLHEINIQVIKLIPKNCIELVITGGEPTLLSDKLFELLEIIKKELPNTEVHMLSNGRLFSVNRFAEKLAQINNTRLMVGIPLYSDYYQVHDYVVQTKDAYYQTIMGIHNLKRYNIRVEIRVVLHKVTVPRLLKLSQYIYRNLTFVDHVAFMGLEVTGHTKAHLDDLWIDPKEYMNVLDKSVTYLSKRKINVSIYNTPLCLLPFNLWGFNRKSISDWKNIYFEECNKCTLLNECGGFFESSTKKYSEYIKSFVFDPRIENENIIVI